MHEQVKIIINNGQLHTSCKDYKIRNGANTDPWIPQSGIRYLGGTTATRIQEMGAVNVPMK